MGTRLYVGNLSYDATDAELRTLFAQAGTVVNCDVIMDKYTNKARGFAFVEMSNQDEANRAISEFNGKQMMGRALTVNEAKPREDRPRGGGGYGGRPDRSEKREFGGGRW